MQMETYSKNSKWLIQAQASARKYDKRGYLRLLTQKAAFRAAVPVALFSPVQCYVRACFL